MRPGDHAVLREGEAAHVPAKCPSCASRQIVTTSKVIDAASYWRCETCGEVWNLARLREGSRYSNRHFGR